MRKRIAGKSALPSSNYMDTPYLALSIYCDVEYCTTTMDALGIVGYKAESVQWC